MSVRVCGLERPIPDLPDPYEGDPGFMPCCAGRAIGPDRCTCWIPVYDLPQTPPVDGAPVTLRERMCGDCAYRPDSPERAGTDGYANTTAGSLDDLATSGQVFWCHQGIRRPRVWRHPPTGTEIPAHPGSYRPPILDGIPYRADGTPAQLCAGWAARRRALTHIPGVHGTPR